MCLTVQCAWNSYECVIKSVPMFLFCPKETKKYMDTIIGYFEQYAEWVKDSVRCSFSSKILWQSEEKLFFMFNNIYIPFISKIISQSNLRNKCNTSQE